MTTTKTVGSGKYTYEMDEHWAKVPGDWKMPACAVYGDSQDRVYCFNRDPDHPIMIFDREGNYLSSWGAGLFLFPHAIILDKDDNVWLVERNDCQIMKFTPDGKRVLVSNIRSGDVAIFNAKSRSEVKRIAMAKDWQPPASQENVFRQGPVPIGILIPPDGKHAYVANTNVNLVTVIDLQKLEISDRLIAGDRPDGLGYSPLVLGKE